MVVISGVISPLFWVITVTVVILFLTRLITTHEPPSRVYPKPALPGEMEATLLLVISELEWGTSTRRCYTGLWSTIL